MQTFDQVQKLKCRLRQKQLKTTEILLHVHCTPGGGYFRNFWVGMCRWDPGTLNLYQS